MKLTDTDGMAHKVRVECTLQVSMMEAESNLVEFLLEQLTGFTMEFVQAQLCRFRTKRHQ
jgi:hypothetical protein